MNRNLSMMTDLYQLTMMNAYFEDGVYKNEAVFDMFYRHKGQLDYAVLAGLEQFVEYINNLSFSDEDIVYLKSTKLFSDGFLKYLKDFKFTGSINAALEGEIVFPYEPILTVKAELIQAQLIETAALNILNHQTLIATKANRIVNAAKGKPVVEFGLRRAQGPDAGIYGSRASIIGGCSGTSNVIAGQMFDIAIKGTQSHSFIMSYKDELSAFEAFAKIYPDNCLLIVDTFDTLNSGLVNAIKVFKKLKQNGHKPVGIRLDSGDLAYLSKKARQLLDANGFEDAIIFASGDIDEDVITALNAQGAKIDAYGVGTKLITSEHTPSLGGVFKLSNINIDGKNYPRMKISESLEKMTNPCLKKVYRIYDSNGMAAADLIALKDEKLINPLVLKHETHSWKQKVIRDYSVRELLVPIFENGICLYQKATLQQSAQKAKTELSKFWDEYKRLINPHIYKVDISDGLKAIKTDILNSFSEVDNID